MFNRLLFFKFLCFLFIYFSCNLTYSQEYQFFGLLKLNDKLDDAIAYRIDFKVNNGKVSGYSITDMTGEHETKTTLEGTYDAKKKWLVLNERGIVYTKSMISKNSFCYINYSGKVDLAASKTKISGKFFGYFPNKEKCIDGTLALSSQGKVQNFLKKAEKKINKTDKIDKATKEASNPVKMFDSLMTNRITKGQNLNIFSAQKEIKLNIFDSRMDDGDIINLYHNEILILKNHAASSKKHQITRTLYDGVNVFKIEAVNEGKVSPNTVMIELIGDQAINLQSTLKTKESSTISIISENK